VTESASLTILGGIGPTDQLTIVKNSATDGATMISSDQWINLPVGYNLNDHVGVSSLPREGLEACQHANSVT
jgi:hypothetical protein